MTRTLTFELSNISSFCAKMSKKKLHNGVGDFRANFSDVFSLTVTLRILFFSMHWCWSNKRK